MRAAAFADGGTLASYLIEYGVCFLALCDQAYPSKLAFAYLEELCREFLAQYREQIGTAPRPYAFIKFGARGDPACVVRGDARRGN